MDHELHAKCLRRAAQSLEGLSCGDAFGERFFIPKVVARSLIRERAVPAPPWFFTDDTVMAFSIFETLSEHGEIKQDFLAKSFAGRYDPGRGYGPAMHTLLASIRRQPEAWRTEPAALFRGEVPLETAQPCALRLWELTLRTIPKEWIMQASLSSATTHTHPEAVAGAVAVALAAGMASRMKDSGQQPNGEKFLQHIHEHLPDSHVRQGVGKAMRLAPDAPVEVAVAKLGNGSAVTAPDTVPFALWCAARHLNSYQEALWTTVSGLGDRDTTCAIVGGIVVMYAGVESIPAEWLEHREQLPTWVSSF